MEGYGLYWYCLECVARNVEQHNLTFELEEDAEIIAADTGIHHERVEEMMRFMVDLRLFENQEGTITCIKMANRADEYTLKLLRTHSGHTPDKVPPIRIEQNRREKKKTTGAKAPSRRFTPPPVEDVQAYCNERGNSVDPQRFIDHYESNGWMRGKNKIKDWKACVRTWEKSQSGGESNASYF